MQFDGVGRGVNLIQQNRRSEPTRPRTQQCPTVKGWKMVAMRRYEGTGVVITGGASGIGLKTAQRIVAEGGRVWLWDVEEGNLNAAKAKLGESARTTRLDITAPAAVERAAAEAERAFGRIDALVCSAGVAGL